MVFDKTGDKIRPRYLVYDIMQFDVSFVSFEDWNANITSKQGSRDVAQCKHEKRLLCITKEVIEPREAAVSV